MSKLSDKGSFSGLELAVIGMAGRFPGANDLETFWNNLKKGVESVAFFSDEELLDAGIEPGVIAQPGYVKAKRVVENKEYFDSAFFGYLPDEAKLMDPQMRMFHECVWEALEDTGYNSYSYQGGIGLFAGAGANFSWQVFAHLFRNKTSIDEYTSLQLNNKEYLVTRISYKLGLKGPAFYVNSACSTSLVAIHLACRSILTGECRMAAAGGITLTTDIKSGYLYREGMIASPDGHCRAFDADAGGTVGGDGAAVVVLKRLKTAVADNDHIYAVIKGSAINNDGDRKVGYTAPGVDGQAEVIRMALKISRVEPQSISFVETHGTGTVLGDPIEVEALTQALGTTPVKSCALGAVKTNIGHLDTAAGAAGFIKTVLAIYYRQIPPTLHFKQPNPKIDFDNSRFYVNTELKAWENNNYPLRAGVSSFGIGGTNVHVILEVAPVLEPSSRSREYQLLLLSARGLSALEGMTARLGNFLEEYRDINLADAAYTLQLGRQAFSHRRMLVCKDTREAVEILSSPGSPRIKTAVTAKESPVIVYMFPGQGSQYVNMGRELYESEKAFREEIDRCFEIINNLVGYDIKKILYPINRSNKSYTSYKSNMSHINQTEVAQVVIFIFEYALARLLIKWGIKPDVMIGHSIGEYVAACISGVLSLEDALQLVALRGKLMQGLEQGAMSSVSLSEEELEPLLPDEISIAAVNTPRWCVVSGPSAAIASLEAGLEGKGQRCRRLHTSHAFHSSMMEPIMEEYEKAVKRVSFNKPGIPYISNVKGQPIDFPGVSSPGYWSTHLRKTVRFSEGAEYLLTDANTLFIEVGPGNMLTTFIRQHPAKGSNHHVINMICHPREQEPGLSYLMDRIGTLWLYGAVLDGDSFYEEEHRRRVSLPTYFFEKIKYPANVNAGLKEYIKQEDGKLMRVSSGWEEDHESSGREDDAIKTLRPELTAVYLGPATNTEKALAKVWQNFFGINRIGVNDDFFELGGDSLKAMTLSGLIHKSLQVELSLADFFANSTIGKLSKLIDASEAKIFIPMEQSEEKEYYHLSSAQERLYILQQMEPGNTAYNLPEAFILEGELSKEYLENTFRRLIQRHESLRTSFHLVSDEPVQRIHEEVEFEIKCYGAHELHELHERKDKLNITNKGKPATRNPQPATAFISSFVRPFDLSQAPLLRVGLVKVEQNKHLLLMDLHHIIYDGSSWDILTREFMELYADNQIKLPPFRVQYRDYAQWQNRNRKKGAIKTQEDYWLNKFKGEIPVLNLPVDYARPAVQSYEGNVIKFEIRDTDISMLKKPSPGDHTTLFMKLLAVFNILLSKLSGQEDIVVGTPAAGRNHPDVQPLIGFFLNTLALRNYPCGHKTFVSFLNEIKVDTLEAFGNQDYPFEALVNRAAVNRDLSRSPLIDTMFILHNEMEVKKNQREIPQLKLRPYPLEKQTSQFDLVLVGLEGEERLVFTLEYCTKLFKVETIQRFITYFKNILSSVLEKPAIKLSQVEIVSKQEYEQLLYKFNNTGMEYPADKTIQQLFEEQVEQTPDNIAVVGPLFQIEYRTNMTYISYRELNENSHCLAHLLREKGVRPDTIVGIKVGRSIEMMIGLLGILKAGCAYLPIDPDYPDERISYMLAHSNTKILLTSEAINRVPTPDDFSFQPSNPSNLAYVIYTSGSTGNPKGVAVKHKNAVNFIAAVTDLIDFSPGKVIAALTTISFDLFFLETLLAVICGLKVIIAAENQQKDPQLLQKLFVKNRVDILQVTPSRLKLLLDSTGDRQWLRGIKELLVGGEVFPPGLFKQIKEVFPGKIYNVYGPTETTIWSTVKNLTHSSVGELNIGTPIANTQVYIVDRFIRPQPLGIVGELLIGGDGTALGYLNNPELTAVKFYRTHQFYRSHRSYRSYILYRTADLARWLSNGEIEFIGRVDFQVKIRGFRIELEEIEEQLLRHEQIKEAVVTVRTDDSSEKHLAAYLVQKKACDVNQLKEYLSLCLPYYMIPSYFIILEQIPLTPSGKIDRKALPSPGGERPQLRAAYVAPGTEKEQILADIWKDVLKLDKVGIYDNFFDLGGNSLNIIQLNRRLNETIKEDIPIALLFKYLTISSFARYWSREEAGISQPNQRVDREEELGKSRTRLKQRLNRRALRGE